MASREQVEVLVWGFAGLCSAFSIGLSLRLIRQHTHSFTKPVVQSKIIGILWMVPIYAVDSWISLRFPRAAIYLDMLRDCYEAYVLYLFLALMVAFIGEGNELRVVSVLETQPPVYHAFPFNVCYHDALPTGIEFLKWCKFGTLQYSVVKPLTTFLAIILEITGAYHETSFDPRYGYLYITIAVNFSVFYAVYVLLCFYIMLKKPLAPYQPVPKFMCIKAVIFFSFWQSVVVAGLTKIEVISAIGAYTAEDVSKGVQDFLICLEMLAAAVAHMYAFPVEPFRAVETQDYHTDPLLSPNSLERDRAPSTSNRGIFDEHFSSDTAIRDFNEVMPVLLPARFTPFSHIRTRIPESRVIHNQNLDPASVPNPSEKRRSQKRIRHQRKTGPANPSAHSNLNPQPESEVRSNKDTQQQNELEMEPKHERPEPTQWVREGKGTAIPQSASPTVLLLTKVCLCMKYETLFVSHSGRIYAHVGLNFVVLGLRFLNIHLYMC